MNVTATPYDDETGAMLWVADRLQRQPAHWYDEDVFVRLLLISMLCPWVDWVNEDRNADVKFRRFKVSSVRVLAVLTRSLCETVLPVLNLHIGIYLARGRGLRKDGYGIAPPLPVNEVLVDAVGGRWTLGRLFATGGFGSLYFVQPPKKDSGTPSVAKLELSTNGPLFQEIHLYQRVGHQKLIDDWKNSHGLNFLGMPRLLASGIHRSFGREYRFLIIPRYGVSIESLRSSAGGAFRPFAVFRLAISCLNVLQYLHHKRYVYADLKGDNILIENLTIGQYTAEVEIWKSYIIDFGLAYLMSPKATYKPEAKNAHNGTRDFTSIDAHCGASPSFRGDVEILGYNILLWLSSSLPWSNCSSAVAVFEMKKALKANLRQELSKVLHGDLSFALKPVKTFFEYVYALGYTERVDFDLLRSVLEPFTIIEAAKLAMANGSSQRDETSVTTSPIAKKPKGNMLRRLEVAKGNNRVKFAEYFPKTSDGAASEKLVAEETSETTKATPAGRSGRIVPGLKNFPSSTRNSILRRLSTMVRKKYSHLADTRQLSSAEASPANEPRTSAAQSHPQRIGDTTLSQKCISPSGRQLRPR
uniref:non-specific serine/threonine protein kinase n=1 Tax=Trichuris muris TaxID=70415 RepID=A0A5S6QQ67_TRIMR